MSARIPLVVAAETPLVTAHAHDVAGDVLVVSFAGIGLDDGTLQPPEFVVTATANGTRPALFVTDPARSWLNADGLIEEIALLIQTWRSRVGAGRVVMLGNSMGGFMAMVMPRFIETAVAVGFSPQFSVDPEVVGDDPRWMQWRSRIEAFRVTDVARAWVPETMYYAFHGAHPRERHQREPFPVQKNMRQFVLSRTVHNVAKKIRGRGLLDRVVEAAFEDRPKRVRLMMEEIGGYRRMAVPAEMTPAQGRLKEAMP